MYGLTSSPGAGRKGQMFVIGSVIIVVVMVLIRTGVDVTEILENKRFLEVGVEKLEFENLRGEVSKSAFNSANSSTNTTNVTNAFIAFAEKKLSARTVDLDGVSVNSQYNNLTASTNIPMNVTFYNFFDVDVTKAVLNLSTDFSSPVTFNDVGPGTTRSTQFTLNLASSQNLTLWVFYETSTISVTQNVTIPADIDKTRFLGYFDLRVSGERGEFRDRFTQLVEAD